MSKNRLGFRRRLLLLCLVLCGGVMATWSIQAMATLNPPPSPVPPAPMAEVTSTPKPAPTPTPTPIPTPTPVPVFDFSQPAPETEPAADDYFDDAVFLGDSRTDGLRLYSGIRGADFLAYKALMVFQVTGTHGVAQKPIAVGEEKMTVLEALKQKQYGKIYVMFGINELGWNKSEDFGAAFRILIDEVRKLQPTAILYIESLIPVNPEKCRASGISAYITNEKVAEYNEVLRQLAAEKGAVYLDLASALADEDGVLAAESTVDGVHFVKSHYVKWFDYLKLHTVPWDAYTAGQPPVEEEAVPHA